jgi:restriction endonuclease S subunit
MKRIELEQLADVQTGNLYDEVDEQSSAGAPVFGLPELLCAGRSRRYADLTAERPGLVRLRTGDLVMALAGSSVGRTVIVDDAHVNDVLGRECARVRLTGESVSAAWIQAWTHTSDFHGQVSRFLVGTGVPRLTRKSLRAIWVPVPSRDQQDRVVESFEAVDLALIEARRTVDELEQLRSKQLDLDLYRLLEGQA